jgi:hypothetical protein
VGEVKINITANVTERKAITFIGKVLNNTRTFHKENLGLIIDRTGKIPVYTVMEKGKTATEKTPGSGKKKKEIY